tara:strand:- start:2554 stop:3555 length:1002 start_codon:yes stop_codon:yes gene_type:complete
MIKNNTFTIKNLKNVVFIGEHESLKDLININDKFKIKSFIVTSPIQKKKIDKNLKHKSFNKLDKSFIDYVSKEVEINKTLFISIKSRWIFKKDIIKKFFQGNLINYHPARLPYYRGGATSSWRIMNGDKIDCQLFHVVSEKVDEGPILYFEKSIVPKNCKTPLDLEKYSSIQIIKLYENFIKILKVKKKISFLKQPSYIGHYFPRLNSKINGWIDWSTSSSNLSRFIDSFDEPYQGAITMYKSKKVFIKGAHLHGGEISKHDYMSGMISRHDGEWITVCTSDENSILISEVIDGKGKNIIKSIKPGDRFYTPTSEIIKSRSYRAKYGPKGLLK